MLQDRRNEIALTEINLPLNTNNTQFHLTKPSRIVKVIQKEDGRAICEECWREESWAWMACMDFLISVMEAERRLVPLCETRC